MFVTFSNKYNFDAGLSDLFTGYLKKQKIYNIFTKATVTINGRCGLGICTRKYICFFKYPVNKFEICKDLFKDPVNI